MESPHSNKTYKNITKNDILIPISSAGNVNLMNKPRAISAHKYNQ
jgi:hypothetical protein